MEEYMRKFLLKSTTVAAVAALCLMGAANDAQARVGVFIGLGLPPVYLGPPVYAYPAPYAYAPYPYPYAAPPYYYAPPPYAYAPPPGYPAPPPPGYPPQQH